MKIIFGKHAGFGAVYSWKMPYDMKADEAIGNYAIVENRNDYALVKVIGLAEVEDAQAAQAIAGANVNKNALRIISRESLNKLKTVETHGALDLF